MREVSVRMVLLLADLARAGEIAEGVVTAELASLQPRDGKLPKYVDWDDFIEATERLERLLGGPEAFARVVRSVLPTAYPELRSFAAIFLRPIPLFSFVMTRLNRANYRNLEMNVERVGEDRVRWRETIPEPFRPSATFHWMTKQLTEIFPCLDLPQARVEMRNMTPRVADFDAVFPRAPSLGTASANAVWAASTVLGTQLEDAFARIGDALRRPDGSDAARDRDPVPQPANAWTAKLELSPRQREVFALLLEGRANKEIASELECSQRNVEFHVGRIMRAARREGKLRGFGWPSASRAGLTKGVLSEIALTLEPLTGVRGRLVARAQVHAGLHAAVAERHHRRCDRREHAPPREIRAHPTDRDRLCGVGGDRRRRRDHRRRRPLRRDADAPARRLRRAAHRRDHRPEIDRADHEVARRNCAQ